MQSFPIYLRADKFVMCTVNQLSATKTKYPGEASYEGRRLKVYFGSRTCNFTVQSQVAHWFDLW